MLILTRRVGETLMINDDISVTPQQQQYLQFIQDSANRLFLLDSKLPKILNSVH